MRTFTLSVERSNHACSVCPELSLAWSARDGAARHSARLAGPTRVLGLVAVLLSAAAADAGSVSTPGTLPITADQVAAGSYVGTGTTPAISEGAAGEWGNGTTIIIEPPSGFRFDTSASITASVDAGDLTLSAPTTKNPNNPFTIMFFVNTASTVASTISFTGITLMQDDTSCDPGAQVGDRSDIIVSTSAGSPAMNNVALVDVSVTHGAAHHLEFTTSPANTVAGNDLLPVVTIRDQCDNACTTDNRTITLAIQSNPGGAALNGTKSLLTVSGVATWTAGQSLDIAVTSDGYTLRASHDGAVFTGTDTVDSAAFNITPNIPHVLEFTTQPVTTDAGDDLLPEVTIKDVHDNVVTNDIRTITLTFQANPGGTTLNGDVDIVTVNGVATWTGAHNLNITKVAQNYQLKATGSGAFSGSDNVNSNTFDITPNVPHVLEFTTQPTTSTAGVPLVPEITIKDAHDNVVTNDDRTITMTFQANPGGATLLGDVDIPTVSGVATWNAGHDMNIEVAATGYQLKATGSGAFTSSDNVNSNAFNITPEATADHVAFTVQPANTTAGADLLPEVTVQDQYDNTVTAGGARTVTLTLLNAGGATLLGDIDLDTAAGVATWTAVEAMNIQKTGTGYQLRATCTGAFTVSNTVDSAAFNIVSAAPDTLEFSVQPVTSTAGVTLTPQVTIKDQYDNVVTNDERTITLTLLNAGGATLLGDVDLLTSSGVATWTGVEAMNITKTGVGYALRATGSGGFGTSNTIDSNLFDITHDVAVGLEFTTQPVNTTAGANLLPEVRVIDQWDNTVTSNPQQTITLTLHDGNPAGTLLGDVDIDTVAGVATWTGGQALNIQKAGVAYYLKATGTAGNVNSNTFDITPEAIADHLTFATQPVTTGAAEDLLPKVEIRDQYDNIMTAGGPHQITLTIENNPSGATLHGTDVLATAAGVAEWTGVQGLNIQTMAVGYTLKATETGGLPFTVSNQVISNAFNITVGPMHHLGFSTDPATPTLAGADLLPVVALQDEFDNTITTDNGRTITLTLINGGGASLNGDNQVDTASGLATWTAVESLDVHVVGAGYKLEATHNGAALPGGDTVQSAAFEITPAVAHRLVFTTDPANPTIAGEDLLPVVKVLDQYDNVVTGDNGRQITLTLINGGGATLNGDNQVNTASGAATWTAVESLDVQVVGTGYKLQATNDGAALPGGDTVQSAAFNITVAAAHHLAFTTNPTSPTVAGVDLLPVVTLQDEFDNTLTTDNGRTITLSLINGGGATLNDDKQVDTSSGVATWTAVESLDVRVVGTGYKLEATHNGAALPGGDTVQSAAFNITVAPAHHLAFTTDPATPTVAGVDLLPVVTLQDEFDNTVTTDNGRTITLSLINGGGATLNDDNLVDTASGVATWTAVESLDVRVVGTGYKLEATHNGAALPGGDTVQSAAFAITFAAADHLAFTTDPADPPVAGVDLLPVVKVHDQYDNVITSDNGRTITLTLINGGGATLFDDNQVDTASGVAVWTAVESLDIRVVGVGYKLEASHNGAALPGGDTVQSAAFEITPVDIAHHLTFTTQPVDTVAGADLVFEVAIEDQFNNTITGIAPRTISITLLNAGGATLIGDAEIDTVNGVATWPGVPPLNITVTNAGYQLRATGSGAYSGSSTVDSAAFDITPALANHLVFSTQPASGTAGVPLVPVVEIRDEYDNVVTGDNRLITLTLLNGGGAALLGDFDLTTVNGVATWLPGHDLNIEVDGNGYQLRASHDGAAFAGTAPADTVDSNAFNISTSAAHHLTFTTQPVNSAAGVPLEPQITIQDEFNNTITGDDRLITLTLLNGGGATLLGDVDLTTVSGVATWLPGHDLNIELVGNGYQLRATQGGAPLAGSDSVDSVAFNITPNVLDHFDAVPSVGITQVDNTVRLTITARDLHDNAIIGYTTTAAITISTNTGGDASTIDYDDGGQIPGFIDGGLTATIPLGTNFDAAGERWVDITNRRAEAITITASDGVVTDGVANVTWTAEPTLNNFLLEAAPDNLTVNNASTLTLTARDQFNNPIPGYTTTAAITISTNTGGDGSNIDYDDGGAIPGFVDGGATATIPAATNFDAGSGQLTLDITNRRAELVTVTASDGVVTDGTDGVTWNPGNPLLLEFTTIADQVAGAPFSITINVTDQFGNAAQTVQTTDISISVGVGSDTLAGTTTGTINAGTTNTTVGPMTYDTAEVGVVLAVERTSGDFLVAGNSNAFTLTGATATKLIFSPSAWGSKDAGELFSVTIQAVDNNDNSTNVAGDTDVILDMFNGTPASLTGNTTGTILDGTGSITINGVVCEVAENPVRLRVSHDTGVPTLSAGLSDSFAIFAAAATTLEIQNILTQSVDVPFSVVVKVLDDYNNDATVAADTDIQLSLDLGGGVLSGAGAPRTISAGSGSTTFSVTYDTAENPVRLRADDVAVVLTAAVSNSFTVSSSPPERLRFQAIDTQTAGVSFSVTVEVIDSGDNLAVVSGDTTVTINVNSGNGDFCAGSVVSGTILDGNSSVTIGPLSYDTAESGVSFYATASGGGDSLAAANSNFFTVGSGTAASLRFVLQPTNTDVTTPLVASVEIIDSLGNRADAANPVTLTLVDANGCGGALGGTTTVNAVAGLAEFSSAEDVLIEQICSGYRLRAHSPGQGTVDSALFNVSAGTNLLAATVNVSITDDTTDLGVTYTITGSRVVDPFVIEFGHKRNIDSGRAIDTVLGYVDVTAGARRGPGTHTIALGDIRSNLNDCQVINGDQLVVLLDVDDEVDEADESDNAASATLTVDLVLESVTANLRYDDSHARVMYTVNSPANVPSFVLRLGFDTDGDGVIDDYVPDVEATDDDLMPGSHTIEITLDDAVLAENLNSDEELALIAILDVNDDVVESNENNNTAGETATYGDGVAGGEVVEEVTTTVQYTGLCGALGPLPLTACILGLIGMRISYRIPRARRRAP